MLGEIKGTMVFAGYSTGQRKKVRTQLCLLKVGLWLHSPERWEELCWISVYSDRDDKGEEGEQSTARGISEWV